MGDHTFMEWEGDLDTEAAVSHPVLIRHAGMQWDGFLVIAHIMAFGSLDESDPETNHAMQSGVPGV